MKKILQFENFISNYSFDKRYKPSNIDEFILSFGQNEFQTAYNWIEKFGGKDLLRDKYIINGTFLFKKLLSDDITIEEIDNVTKGKHGQIDDLAFSDTNVAKNIIIPAIEYIKIKNNTNKYNL